MSHPLADITRTPVPSDAESSDAALDDDARRALVDELNARARAVRHTDFDRLRTLADRAFEAACQVAPDGSQYSLGMGTALALLAHRSNTLGDLSDALSQAGQAIALLEPLGPSTVLGEALGTLGWTHFFLGDYVEALEALMRALHVSETIGDTGLQAYALEKTGSVHASSGHCDVALDLQQRALALHRELRDPLGEATVLNNMAYTQMDLADYDGALESAHAALAWASGGEHRYLLCGVLDTIAEIHLRVGEPDEAEEYTRQALELALELGSQSDEATNRMTLGRIHCAREEWDEALVQTAQALAIAERKQLGVEAYECHRLLSDINERCGDCKKALAHYRRFHELKQTRVNEETQARLANLRVAHQIDGAKKDAEIQRLRSLALEQEVEERRVAQARLEAQASLDPLTGLFNRGHLAMLTDQMRSGQTPLPVSLLMLDIDRFKMINDTHGHVAGDRVLISITRQISANFRQSDVACRYGGDEFLVLLTGMDAEGARTVSERLREVVAASPVAYGACADPRDHQRRRGDRRRRRPRLARHADRAG